MGELVNLPSSINVGDPGLVPWGEQVGAVLNKATHAATPSTLPARDAFGRLQVADPANDADAVTKLYVDTAVAGPVLANDSIVAGLLDNPASATSALLATTIAAGQDHAMSMLSWRTALASRDAQPANVVCLGDSITEFYAASTFDRRWVNRLGALLRAKAPVAGVVGGAGYISPAVKSGTPLFTWPGTYSGAGTSDSAGPKKRVWGLTAAGHEMTYNVTGTAVDVIGYRNVTGTISFNVQVDGGTPVTYPLPTSTLNAVWSQRVSLGSAGAHTVIVSYNSGTVYTFGLVVYNGDENAGVRVHECGWYGATVATWGSTGRWAADLGMLNPDLLIISLGTNDKDGIDAATFETQLGGFVDYLRASIPRQFSIVLQSYASADGVNPWANYVQAMVNVATARSEVVVVNQGRIMPRYSDDTSNVHALYYSDGKHLADAGMALVASNLAEFLVPNGAIGM